MNEAVRGAANRTAPTETLEAALREMERWQGIGCEYWLEPRYGLSGAVLQRLGVATMITRAVPRCDEHGCALLERCPHRADFERRVAGIGSKKYHLTAAGRRGVQEGLATVLPDLVRAWPLANQVQAVLAAAGRPLSIFELAWQLAAPALESLLSHGDERGLAHPEESSPSRRELRLALDLLAAAGLVQWVHGGEFVAARFVAARYDDEDADEEP